ncbi:unnamed protein product, partial [Brenthis ino]
MAARVPLLVIFALLFLDCCYGAAIPRAYDPRLSEDVILTPKKRPFCNAFTGCGRKRSQGTPGMPMQELFRQRQLIDEDSVPLMDMDPTLDELSRQVIADAKMWGLLRDEISRRRNMDYQ